MKVKKNSIEKIVLGILTFILIIYISLSLMFCSFFNISGKVLNKNNMYDFISNIDIVSILKQELGNELQEFDLIKEDLSDIGITTEGINEFINSNEVKEFSVDVVTKVFNKVSNKSDIDYKITNEQINELLEGNIDKLEINASISEEQILDKIENKIPDLVLNINELLDKFCNKLENSDTFQKYQGYIYSSINILDIIYSDFLMFVIIFIVISFILLLIFIRKSIYKSLKWLSISFIIPAMIFAVISTIIFSFVNSDNILFNNILNIINKDLIKHSVIYFIVAFILALINVIIYIIKKYKDKEKVLHE